MVNTLAHHPFISFEFDTSDLQPDIWFMLGEAMSKCQHLAGVPLKPRVAEELTSLSLARGVQATTAIEGNTLSDAEVKKIVERGTAGVSESRAYLEREVQNVLEAVREIDRNLAKGIRLPITTERLCTLNRQVLAGIPDKQEVVPGEFREHDVSAGPYLAPHWTEGPQLVERLVKWLDQMRGEVNHGSRVQDRFVNAVLSAILAHLYIAWVHPFGNGNGRLARLVEVQILSDSGIVPLVATNLLSDHYNKTRAAYYLALDGAQRDVVQFVRYAVRGFADELRDQIAVVRQENLDIHWESYVYEVFRREPNTAARDRQRDVALSLREGVEVTADSVTTLTTHLAQRYATCGPRTPARDLNTLTGLGLVTKIGRRPYRYRAQREVIEAFIPPVAD